MPATMLLRNLQRIMDLTASERESISGMPEHVLRFERQEDIVEGNRKLSEVRMIRAGVACRYSVLGNGQRQISQFLVPGDCCDLSALLMQETSQSVAALGPCEVAVVPHGRLFAAMEKHPRLVLALWSNTLFDAAVHREWVSNIGRRPAYARIAHVLCEIWFRLHSVGLALDHVFDFPATQSDLGDATGLSLVHVNRTLKELRKDGLIRASKGRMELLDWKRLTEAAEFDPAYLRLPNLGA